MRSAPPAPFPLRSPAPQTGTAPDRPCAGPRPGTCAAPLRGIGALAVLSSLLVLFSGCATTDGAPGANASGDLLPVRCLEEPDLGPVQRGRLGYFYDYRENRCKPFRYGGAGAQLPFETQAECIDLCVAEP